MLAATPLRLIADRLFRNDDAQARRRGWQVTVLHGGSGRAYRDPRFDLLQACPACLGTGTGQQDQDCDPCSGTGRVMLAGKADTEAGRGQ
jgi:hypothetical protein